MKRLLKTGVLTLIFLFGCQMGRVEPPRDVLILRADLNDVEKRVMELERELADEKSKNTEELKALKHEINGIQEVLRELVTAMKREVADRQLERDERKRALREKRDEFVDRNLERTFNILEKILERLEREVDRSLEKPAEGPGT